ncbi:MAG: hypothetical protein ABFS56_21625, partial [Pseudomonadota bacterium]
MALKLKRFGLLFVLVFSVVSCSTETVKPIDVFEEGEAVADDAFDALEEGEAVADDAFDALEEGEAVADDAFDA